MNTPCPFPLTPDQPAPPWVKLEATTLKPNPGFRQLCIGEPTLHAGIAFTPVDWPSPPEGSTFWKHPQKTQGQWFWFAPGVLPLLNDGWTQLQPPSAPSPDLEGYFNQATKDFHTQKLPWENPALTADLGRVLFESYQSWSGRNAKWDDLNQTEMGFFASREKLILDTHERAKPQAPSVEELLAVYQKNIRETTNHMVSLSFFAMEAVRNALLASQRPKDEAENAAWREEIQGAIHRSGMGILRTSQGPSGTMIGYRPEVEAAHHKKTIEVINENADLGMKLTAATKRAEEAEKNNRELAHDLEVSMTSADALTQERDTLRAQLTPIPRSERLPTVMDGDQVGDILACVDGWIMEKWDSKMNYSHWLPLPPIPTVSKEEKERAEFEEWWNSSDNFAASKPVALLAWQAARKEKP